MIRRWNDDNDDDDVDFFCSINLKIQATARSGIYKSFLSIFPIPSVPRETLF